MEDRNHMILSLFIHLITFVNSCSVYLQSNSIKYLNPSQLLMYNITDPCTTTCVDGYYGDFCQNLATYSNLPMGPWNQAGYCKMDSGILRSMTINVNNINSIQYTPKESVLVGISNAGRASSVIYEISLYARTVSPYTLPTSSGTLDAVLVRKGVMYAARTIQSIQVLGRYSYDVAVLTGAFQAQILMPITTKAVLMEVCVDKGTRTVFVYGSGQVMACYPTGSCIAWAAVSAISGIIGGADCKNTLYASSYTNILKITSAGSTILKATPTTIYCLTGLPNFNILLYKSKNNMWQVNLGTGEVISIPLGITQTQEVVCSADVSEQSNQILIVQNGIISTLEAVQVPCPFGHTSSALLCNSTAQCIACPPPPNNAYHIEGSVDCSWACLPGFDPLGSKCVAPIVQPCPAYYRAGDPGLCIPSVLPWADQGKYATIGNSYAFSFPTANSPVYLLTSDGPTLIHALPGQFWVSRNGMSWAALLFKTYLDLNCPSSSQNSYYYLSSRQGVLWIAFTTQRPEGTQHCLWAVKGLNYNATLELRLEVIQSWVLSSPLCSATGEGGMVYAILCNYNYVSLAAVGLPSTLSPVIGNPERGYMDGLFQAARLNAPSSLVAYDSRLYIADTGNCVIREVDLTRGVVGTVSGLPGTCQRADGTNQATLVRPINLIYTPYDGFFLFTDQYTTETNAMIRQFHAPTSTIKTIKAAPLNFVTSLAASNTSIFVLAQRTYHIYNATWEYCQAGTSSLAGNAYDLYGCLACQALQYSDTSVGACMACSSPTCTLPGQLFNPCTLGADAYCGGCTNKPTNSPSQYNEYIGASSIGPPGDCAWAYTPPCPAGYYDNSDNGLCASCPKWSTSSPGSSSMMDCKCMGGGGLTGAWNVDVYCVVPSPFAFPPAICNPLLECAPYAEPASLYPILPISPSCSFVEDSQLGVCPCQPGEYIQQIYPKICTPCPPSLYSPSGRDCMACPYLTEPSLDKATCRCAAGTRDVALYQEPECVCGPGKAFYASMGCVACPQNTYNGHTARMGELSIKSPMQCLQCPDGRVSNGGAVCDPCPGGQYRQSSDLVCQSCPPGQYAPDSAAPNCVDCSAGCGGMKETECPTDKNLFMCSACPEPRANSAFNGYRDCATSCNAGLYELDSECVPCMEHYKATCPEGNRYVPCSRYANAGCVGCVNASMPLNFAVWSYVPQIPGGPSTSCEWECEVGYSKQNRVETWECAKAEEWSVWDLFTL